MDEQEWLAGRFESNRAHLRAVAYRMLGSLDEADDAARSGASDREPQRLVDHYRRPHRLSHPTPDHLLKRKRHNVCDVCRDVGRPAVDEARKKAWKSPAARCREEGINQLTLAC